MLIVSLSPWDESNSFGNSFSNIFGGDARYEFANIYCESGSPRTTVCKYFFQITLKSILKSIFTRGCRSGAEVFSESQDSIVCADSLSVFEGRILNVAKRLRFQILFWARDIVWSNYRWRSKELDTFITNFAPDVIFQPIFYSSYANEIGLYAGRLTNRPMLGYISDDNYTYRQFSLSPLFWIDRAIKRRYVKRAIDSCKILYTITDRQRLEYSEIFGDKCKVLSKGGVFVDFEADIRRDKSPIRVVYSGNLGSGRLEVLTLLAEVLSRINEKSVEVELFVYSMSAISNSAIRGLNIEGTSSFCGGVESGELGAIHRGADILVHVESFRLSERYSSRLSFSTKIVDYLEAGRCVLAIGWGGSGAIEYLRAHGAAIVISDKSELFKTVSQLVGNHQLIDDCAERGFHCGRARHQIEEIRNSLHDDMIVVCDRTVPPA